MKALLKIVLLVLPAVCLHIPYNIYAQTQSSAQKIRTVVIDPGHGGKDPGAVSRDGKTYEKNVVLDISKKLGAKIKETYPDVKVIYTRTTDSFVTLRGRSDVANRNNADLFISVHINSVKNSTAANGFSTYIYGPTPKNTDAYEEHLEVCRQENAVEVLYEGAEESSYLGYDPNDPASEITFQLMNASMLEQSLCFAEDIDAALKKGPFQKGTGVKQNTFFVLKRTTRPCVLLELGFISNLNDLKILRSTTGRERIAQCLFDGFRKYKEEYDSEEILNQVQDDSKSVQDDAQAVQNESHPERSGGPAASDRQKGSEGPSASAGSRYGIQVLLLSRKLAPDAPEFKGYKATAYKTGNVYKYVLVESDSKEKVNKIFSSVKKQFPDAFKVRIENDKIVKF